MEFVPGALGEAIMVDEGLVGALASGKIVSVAGPRSKVVMFQYDELNADVPEGEPDKPLAENVDKARLRPLPPVEAFELSPDAYKGGLKVDVFDSDLWWEGTLNKAGGGWVVKCLVDEVAVTPHNPDRTGISASQFVSGNVRPGLEWKDGAFYWRGTSRKWEGAGAAAGLDGAPGTAEPAARGKGAGARKGGAPAPAAAPEPSEDEEPAAAAAPRKGRGKAQTQAKQQQKPKAAPTASYDDSDGGEEEEAKEAAAPAAGKKRPAESAPEARPCKNCKQSRVDDDGTPSPLYTYISPKERREGPYCARCIRGWREHFPKDFGFYEYDPEIDGEELDPDDVDGVVGRKAVSIAALGAAAAKKGKGGAGKTGRVAVRGGAKQKGG